MSRFLHSSSAQKYFATCPQQFWLYQTGAEKGPSPEVFRFGITAHLVMQYYVDHCIAAKRRSDIAVIGEYIDRAVRKSGLSIDQYDELSLVIRDYLKVYEIDVEHSYTREGGLAFDDNLNAMEWSEGLSYEHMRRPMDHAAQGVMLRMQLDEVLIYPDQKRLVVRDFKTDRFAPSQTQIEDPASRFNQQARKYAMAARRAIYPADLVEVEFPFIRYTNYGKALTRKLAFSAEDLDIIEEQELAKVRFIEETTSFPARPSDHCTACSYRTTSCPVATEVVTDDPASIARKFVFQRVQQEEFRDRIKEYVAQFGWSGEIGALKAEFDQSESLQPDMELVWKELSDIGFDNPWRVLNFSKTDAKNVLDKDAYERIVATAYSQDIAVRFNLHQKKEKLQELARERGISLTTQGKTGPKDKTVAQLAWDLAQWEPLVESEHVEPAEDDWSDAFTTPTAELSLIEELA